MSGSSGLSLRQLRAFWHVAQEGSMTRAAQKMHLTSSALSMLVRTLEEELGVRLFERTTRKLELTEAGRQFLPAVRDVFFSLDAGLETLKETKRRKSERLTVATSPLLAAACCPRDRALPRALPRRRRDADRRPGRPGGAAGARGQGGLRHLHRRHRAGRPGHPGAVRGHAGARLQSRPPDGRPSPGRLGRPGRPAPDPADARLGPAPARRAGARAAHAAGQAGVRGGERSDRVGLVAAGLGVSALPAYSLARVEGERVSAVPLVDPVVTREIVAVCTRARPFSMAAEAFLKLFKESAEKSGA